MLLEYNFIGKSLPGYKINLRRRVGQDIGAQRQLSHLRFLVLIHFLKYDLLIIYSKSKLGKKQKP